MAVERLYLRDPPSANRTCGSIGDKIAACIPLLRAMARARVASPAQADALVRDTLHEAAVRIAERRSKPNLKAWLLALQRQAFSAGERTETGRLMLTCHDDSACRAQSGMHWGLLRLPDRLREVLVLSDGAEMGHVEIAEILGCTIADVAALVREGRSQLLALLEKGGTPRATRLAPNHTTDLWR